MRVSLGVKAKWIKVYYGSKTPTRNSGSSLETDCLASIRHLDDQELGSRKTTSLED